MKGYNNKIITLIIGILFIFGIGILSVSATWQSVAKSQTICPSYNSLDVFAENGDVVTVDKWNAAICKISFILDIISNWPGGVNQLFIVTENSVTKHAQVMSMNLPTSTIAEGTSYPGSISFRDPTLSYQDPAGFGGKIYYLDKVNGKRFASLDFENFTNGIRIQDTVTGHFRVLGWEKILLSDISDFLTDCQYRVVSPTAKYYVSVVEGNKLSVVTNSSYWTIRSTNKLLAEARSSIDVTGPVVENTPVPVIEQLCLPSYNPYNH